MTVRETWRPQRRRPKLEEDRVAPGFGSEVEQALRTEVTAGMGLFVVEALHCGAPLQKWPPDPWKRLRPRSQAAESHPVLT